MLTKTLALWIVLLAASPLTQPFSTITFNRLRVDPAAHGWSVAPVHASSIADVDPDDASVNPPVEIRQAGGFAQPFPAGAAGHPAAKSPARSTGSQQAVDARDGFTGPNCLFSVLRL